LEVSIPFLNSYSKHKQIIVGYIVSDVKPELTLHKGNGKGWSANFISEQKYAELLSTVDMVLQAIPIVLFTIGLGFVGYYYIKSFKLPMYQVFLNPTTENIESSIAQYSQQLENLYSASSFWGKFQAIANPHFYTLLPGFIPIILSLIVMSLSDWLAKIYTNIRLGIKQKTQLYSE
jgi:hypothetical protein